jgi:hypothetical protein
MLGVLAIGALLIWTLPALAQGGYGAGQGGGRGTADGDPVRPDPLLTTAGGDLSESEVEALHLALDDEYQAWAVYDQVIADFGAVRPFRSIRSAEAQHIDALVTLFERYGLDVPANDWPGNVPTFGSLPEACAAAVEVETANVALYNQLFGMVDNADLVQVFTALQNASQTKHLPALTRCAR